MCVLICGVWLLHCVMCVCVWHVCAGMCYMVALCACVCHTCACIIDRCVKRPVARTVEVGDPAQAPGGASPLGLSLRETGFPHWTAAAAAPETHTWSSGCHRNCLSIPSGNQRCGRFWPTEAADLVQHWPFRYVEQCLNWLWFCLCTQQRPHQRRSLKTWRSSVSGYPTMHLHSMSQTSGMHWALPNKVHVGQASWKLPLRPFCAEVGRGTCRITTTVNRRSSDAAVTTIIYKISTR